LKDLKEGRSGKPTERYRQLALILEKIPTRGNTVWQNADLLLKFRNSLMHFKPAWDSETDIHEGKLVGELKKRVPVAPSLKPNAMFPYVFMTYGCAKWAVETARVFSAEFCALIGVGDRFAGGTALP
jgi:hypothetical protein